jgi:hypothetical protein
MKRPMLIRSIGLSERTMLAWKQHNAYFPKRERSFMSMLTLHRDSDPSKESPIINLGNTGFNVDTGEWSDITFNLGSNIQPLVRPGDARRLLDGLLPPRPSLESTEPYWVKAPGMGGRGKRLSVGVPVRIPEAWDLQVHIDGQEYRVYTVDDKVVQVFARYGENGDRTYEWVGVKAAPQAIKDLAREGARRLSGRNIVGWDLILDDDRPYILEGNTSPGVNERTVDRILGLIYGRSYDNA